MNTTPQPAADMRPESFVDFDKFDRLMDSRRPQVTVDFDTIMHEDAYLDSLPDLRHLSELSPDLYGPTKSKAKIAKRLSMCGTFGVIMNPASGGFRPIKYKCGLWREGCPHCLAERKADFIARWDRIRAQTASPLALVMTEQEATKIARKLRDHKAAYLRIPHPDLGDVIVFDSTVYGLDELDPPESVRVIETEHLEDEQVMGVSFWERAAETPGSRRVSGSLGKALDSAASTDDESAEITVKTPKVYVEAGTSMTLSQCADAAIVETADLDPAFDVDELERAMEKRMLAFSRRVIASGGRVHSWTLVSVKLSVNMYTGWKDIQFIRQGLDALDVAHAASRDLVARDVSVTPHCRGFAPPPMGA